MVIGYGIDIPARISLGGGDVGSSSLLLATHLMPILGIIVIIYDNGL
jgi:hypothetical protein